MKIGVEAFICSKDSLLLGLRKNVYGAGGWGLPGGHLEPNESLKNGLKREIMEELGVDTISIILKVIHLQIQPRKNGGCYIHFGYKVVVKGEINQITLRNVREPDKCQKWQFINVNDLNKNNIFVGHIREIRAYFKNIFFTFSIGNYGK